MVSSFTQQQQPQIQTANQRNLNRKFNTLIRADVNIKKCGPGIYKIKENKLYYSDGYQIYSRTDPSINSDRLAVNFPKNYYKLYNEFKPTAIVLINNKPYMGVITNASEDKNKKVTFTFETNTVNNKTNTICTKLPEGNFKNVFMNIDGCGGKKAAEGAAGGSSAAALAALLTFTFL